MTDSMKRAADGFDLDRYLRVSQRVDLSHVNWREVKDYPLSEAEARTLTYMMDIESHTIVFLRDLLATRVVLEPEITAFFSCWAYEELWHGEAFSRFLGEAGYELPPYQERVSSDSAYPSRSARNAWIRKGIGAGRIPYLGKLVASVMIRDFVAVHMTWGAVNELSVLTGYRLLSDRTGHPVLRDILRAISKDERRHFAFYRAQARLRLSSSPRAQAVTRWTLNRLWAPVGTGVRPQAETDHTICYLFDNPAGLKAISDMDSTIEELPGLGGIGIFKSALSAALARSAR